MSYQSEAKLEENLIKQLINQGFDFVKTNNEDELKQNFRNKLFEHNKSKLNNEPFTDKEFERILNHIEGKSVFQSSMILRDKFILERENQKEVYIELFDTKNYSNNIFQVTNQTTVNGKYKNRYDVTLLINGLPLIQIELKRRGLDLKEAFNQINRYKRHSYQGLYRYIQIFIISNGVDTKYFANSDKEILFSQTFFFSDEKNNRITKLSEFTKNFLDKNFISKVISRYMVTNETDKLLMVMRPYQIFAVESLLKRATETNKNGYIWHTTGSGKTLTSFKVSQLLALDKNIKKVFFLVDRKDLDAQTLSEFNKFELDSVDTTDKTETLIKHIDDINKPLIITTIQKMANAIKKSNNPKEDMYHKVMNKYKNEKVIFIIDECHRSQFGDMHKSINKHFVNAKYFGFTGTPRFIENKSQEGRVTADIFGECLHTYLIKDAINDGNVLGFSVEYIKTFDGNFDEEDDEKVNSIDKEEVFICDDRIELISNHIIKNHHLKTRNMQYNSIFAVQSIPMLIKYYDEFKKINHNLKIAGIFTFSDNEDLEDKKEHSRDSLERIIKDYNKMFDTNYSTDTFSSYFKDVSKRVKSGEIDILIVVNMFLTGFDSKTLNTLYVDKNLKYHDLLQAYSRTNRIEKQTKPYGNVVCYRNLKKNTDEALCLFSQTDNTDTVLMESYEYYMNLWNENLENIMKLTKTPEDVDKIESEEDKKKFVILFRELTKVLTKLNTFTEFEFEESKLNISEQTYQDFKSKYFMIYESIKHQDNEKTSILSDIDFAIEIMQTDKINVGYIMNLVSNIDLSDEKNKQRSIENVMNKLDKIDNLELRRKVDLIKEFLQKVVPKLNINDNIDFEYMKFEENKRLEEVSHFAYEIGLSEEFIKESVAEYEYSGIVKREEISNEVKEKLKPKFLERKNKIDKIQSFIYEYTEKYN